MLTGGRNRRRPEHVESDAHARLLRDAGIPDEAMLVERVSTSTAGNVEHARPLIEQRLGEVHTVIAVVKWFHRRALHSLAAGMPSVTRIYAVTWNPTAPGTGEPVTRDNWWTTSRRDHVENEYRYLKRLLDAGALPALVRDGHGWVRAQR